MVLINVDRLKTIDDPDAQRSGDVMIQELTQIHEKHACRATAQTQFDGGRFVE